jgi:hypothetical protein
LECNNATIQKLKKAKKKHLSKKLKIKVEKHSVKRSKRGTLVDRGANGGILGNDAIVIFRRQKTVDVTGIDNHELSSLVMVDASAKIMTDKGPAIVILRNYAYHGVNRTLHSAGQIEYFGNKVFDTSIKSGGRQVILTVDGYYIPIDIIRGLPYIKMVPNTAKEFEELPHIIFTQGGEWDPSVLDFILSEKEGWQNDVKRPEDAQYVSSFDERGEYRHREPVVPKVTIPDPEGPPSEEPYDVEDGIEASFHDQDATSEIYEVFETLTELNKTFIYEHEELPDDDSSSDGVEIGPQVEVKSKPIDYDKCRRNFLHVSVEKIRRTFAASTQNAVMVMSGPKMNQSLKSPNPALNIHRRNEPLAADTIYASVPAVDSPGWMAAQMFVGRK